MSVYDEVHAYVWAHKEKIKGLLLFLAPGNGGGHQPDEWISVEGLLNACELTARMLLACDEV